MVLRKVAVVGATGELGEVVYDAIVKAGTFEVSVVRRASSTSTPAHAEEVSIIEVPDDWPADVLEAKLRGQDAVVVLSRTRDVAQHNRLATAAAAAGVKRFIPADYGSCDSRSQRAREVVPLFDKKNQVRDHLVRLAASHPGFSWSSIICGHFFDWGLRHDFLHCFVKTRTAHILDSGDQPCSLSTLGRVGEAVVAILQKEEETKNKLLFIQSFCITQNQLIKSLEKATGTKWTVEQFDSEEFIKKHKALADGGDLQAVEDLVFALGAIDGNWEVKPEFAMDLLGLKNEDLDCVVASTLKSMQ
ncbi:uncharacterized protein E0L32_000753 [Thyridium curvatum]|uniref:NmrA-like domain-containing protein n=1 Tax=Thyridium curvatum TaxID=1093900 RepID=A0A507B0H9_9PEZI|nr:uncharacterized protein E0L32_000753 [Thyridium curvatum]TPX12576.1 hypothetical protein E0L32_000753 [Thyridium curvatum]